MREIWKSAEEAVITGDVQKLDRLLRDHRQLLTENTPPPYVPRGPGPCYCDVVALRMRAGAMAPQRWFEEPPRDDFVGQLQADRRMLAALGAHP